MWVGIDDTDSIEGGCTTYIATEIINEIPYNLIGLPHLVRLNPNIPWKTRGNGAIAIKFGEGGGEHKKIGEINGEEVFCYSFLKKEADIDEIIEIVDKLIKRSSRKDSEPAFVISKFKLPYHIYTKAVREVLKKEDVEKKIKGKVFYKTYDGGRGLIGAVSAIAWKPKDFTYELITYGKEKWIDKKSVIEMDKLCKSTFNNYDYENDYIAILPKANSPVFYGIRGDDIEELIKAKNIIVSSKEERWIIFKTNQATDEHLQKKRIKDIKPYESVITRGKVKKEPHTIRGGHVIFSIYDGNEIECSAYEPTKGFREIILELKRGDEVIVYGGVRKKPFTINIEKIRIIKVADVYEKIENPVCENCKKHMKSMGRGKGYRCSICGKRAGEEEAKYLKISRKISPGFYEVPVIARRHIAKPLKRFESFS
ncbi:MAG TPA: DUF1743 domain-containing protein [Thermoplasmata archaeon]|nr:DUF1743 domain-containing protein [Thermoplasmata archaeon]